MNKHTEYIKECLANLDEVKLLLRDTAHTIIWNGELSLYANAPLGQTPHFNLQSFLEHSDDPDVQAIQRILLQLADLRREIARND